MSKTFEVTLDTVDQEEIVTIKAQSYDVAPTGDLHFYIAGESRPVMTFNRDTWLIVRRSDVEQSTAA